MAARINPQLIALEELMRNRFGTYNWGDPGRQEKIMPGQTVMDLLNPGMVNREAGKMLPDLPQAFRPFEMKDNGSVTLGYPEEALAREGQRRLGAGEVMLPPGATQADLQSPENLRNQDMIKELLENIDKGNPTPGGFDPSKYPGMEDFLKPGMGDEQDMNDMMEMFGG